MAKNEKTVVTKELRTRADAELSSLLAAKVEELQKARFKHALGQLRTTHTLKALRREVARIETVLAQRATTAKQEVTHG